MCGIVAVFGNVNNDLKTIFEELFIIDQVRGRDSCGIAAMHNHGVSIVKDIYDPDWLLNTKKYEKMKDRNDLLGFIGHNRFATKGEIKEENAHPFSYGSITGVHNGTIPWTENFPDHTKFSVDSENLIYAINKIGIDKAWQAVGYGAAAIVYYDSKNKSLNLMTNGKRPLFFAYSKNEDAILVASEGWMIRAIANRNQFELKDGDKIPLFYPDNDTQYSFTYEKKKVHLKIHKIPPKPVPERKLFNHEEWEGSGYANDAWWNRRMSANQQHVEQDNKKPNIAALPNPADKKMEEAVFDKQYKFCAGCGAGMRGKFAKAIILDGKNAICDDCSKVATDNEDLADKQFSTGNSLVH